VADNIKQNSWKKLQIFTPLKQPKLFWVNFSNVLRAAFTSTDPKSAKRLSSQGAFPGQVIRLFLLFWDLRAQDPFDEIDSLCQFYQHFTYTFFDNILEPKNVKPKTQLFNFWHQNTGTKCARKMLMKSIPCHHRQFNVS
jgi:hypothetical protein